MKIYTKTGDSGETSLLGNIRVPKCDMRVEAYGTIDEANSYLGLVRYSIIDKDLKNIIINIQKKLFDVAAELASIDRERFPEKIREEDVLELEKIIDEYSNKIPKQQGFVIPGNSKSAYFDVARTIIRRAERCIISLNFKERVNPHLIKYINRLSDLIYILARFVDYSEIYEKVKKVVGLSPIKKMNLELARKIAESAEYMAEKIGIPVVITIVDDGGNLVLQERMDGALLLSINISKGKAYTAVALKMNTEDLKDMTGPNGELLGINTVDKKVVTFGGGIALKIGNDVIGGLGVSGGTVEQDMKIAKAGFEKFKEVMYNGD
ncbi:cob(I)yrinic acid a,c-diamide adenosyltransferase [Thermoanaerobacterium sp. RBIITD]|uniref:cob(I)yrinic acid a,c-diamide adenosyltransferase n=1 Tax=Thermoanaerobacterium sp. RBIITD TaxID=1550240 RepID=UPI000BB753B7|nr:cob(I)yrinic acid a,c-diamide adenosyltransferase [Thermoanaerobacterium sp. RBIITD]SNX54727.1 cob(I)alamin adenosyltransferase [Thermoanaerobacterium sp. RBIITD]